MNDLTTFSSPEDVTVNESFAVNEMPTTKEE